MAYDFDSIELPKIDLQGNMSGVVGVSTLDDGTIDIRARNHGVNSDSISITRENAIALAKFLSEVYL